MQDPLNTSSAQLDAEDRLGRKLLADSLSELTNPPANITSLDDSFIQRHINQPVTVFLANGVKLSGLITINSPSCFTLSRDGITQLVMKRAVATIMPTESL